MEQTKIGSFLKELRKQKGLTQEQLAEKLNVSNRSVSRWETGNTLPDIAVLVELSEFYNIDIKEILDGERRNNDINMESKELINAITNYTNRDMEIILNKIKRYSCIAICTLFLGIIFAIFDFSKKFYQITDLLFGLALISIIMIWLLSNDKIEEARKKKSNIKYFIFLLAILILTILLLLFLSGIIG
ncbi:MAG: helix-turn-helix transcriptional regulator [Ruminococcus sp.]|nr:helix-turn-helix transcriptional regulator [Ruminococcus sp.]